MPYKYNPFTKNLDEVNAPSSADVVGPGSSTDNALVRWDGTAGTDIQNSNATLTDAGDLTLTGGLTLGTDLAVSEGGTGVSSVTGILTGNGTSAITGNAVSQYAVLVGGASNAVDEVASVGTSGQVLTSNGAGSKPTFQDAAAGGAQNFPAMNVTISGKWNIPNIGIYGSTVGLISDRLYLVPFYVTSEVTLNNVAVAVTSTTSTGSVVRLGMYSMNLSTGAFTLVSDFGTTDADTTGIRSISAGGLTLSTDTRYFAAIVVDENGGTVNIGATTQQPGIWWDASGNQQINYLQLNSVGTGALASSYALATLSETVAASFPLLLYNQDKHGRPKQTFFIRTE